MSDAELVRALLREAQVATIATTERTSGRPYASLVEVATSVEGQPLLLLSRLARHTRNLLAAPAVAVLSDRRHDGAHPLTSARVTLMGRARLDAGRSTRERYLRRHGDAAVYADFADFQFWSVAVDDAHLVAGFGRIREVAAAELRLGDGSAGPSRDLIARLATDESEIIATLESELPLHSPMRIVGLDAEGVDVLRFGRHQRLAFGQAAEVMDRLLTMARGVLSDAVAAG
ncbi:MAG: HugZ family protein [Hyphomicrobiaceae bacterium]